MVGTANCIGCKYMRLQLKPHKMIVCGVDDVNACNEEVLAEMNLLELLSRGNDDMGDNLQSAIYNGEVFE